MSVDSSRCVRSGSDGKQSVSISSKDDRISTTEVESIRNESGGQSSTAHTSPSVTSLASTGAIRQVMPPLPVLLEHKSLARQLWHSPFIPRKTSEWPNAQSKQHWFGPFETGVWYERDNTSAKKACETNWKEDESICKIRKLAESLYELSDFAGARCAWAQIADHYRSEPQRILKSNPNFDEIGFWDKQELLRHINKVSIGCILDSYFAQHPHLRARVSADDEGYHQTDRSRLDPALKAILQYEDDLTNSRTLRVVRVLLDYASYGIYGKDRSWIRVIYERATDAVQQMTNPNLSDTIHLWQGSIKAINQCEKRSCSTDMKVDGINTLSHKQRKAYKIQRAQSGRSEIEDLYLHLITDQRALSGAMSDAAIDCELALVKHYTSVGDWEKAEANVRQLCILTNDRLGEDDSNSIFCLSSLSNLLMDKGFFEEAGLNLHNFFKKHFGTMYDLADFPRMWDSEKLQTNRGWDNVISIKRRFESLKAPWNFIWADYRLYTLRIGAITFVSSYPTNAEKEDAWTITCTRLKNQKSTNIREGFTDDESSAMNCKDLEQQPHNFLPAEKGLRKFTFRASERDNEFLDLDIPFIPYPHFMNTSAFRTGTPYLEYVKAAEDPTISAHICNERHEELYQPIQIDAYLKIRKNSGRKSVNGTGSGKLIEKRDYVEIEFDDDTTTVQIQGFLNNIPAEAYIIPELFVDVVSSQWIDYRQFILHPLPNNSTEIEVAEEICVPCHGYISGMWTDFGVCKQGEISKMFVVDAKFIPIGSNGELPLFAMRPNTLQSLQCHEVSNTERRTFCARLNPSFYRYQPYYNPPPKYAVDRIMRRGKPKLTKAEKLEIELEEAHWTEMNAREKWDRNFEDREPANDAAGRASLLEDLKTEMERRRMWDVEYRKKRRSGEGESTSDSHTMVDASVPTSSVENQLIPPTSNPEQDNKSSTEARGGTRVSRILRRVRLKGRKVEAPTSQVASSVC